MNQSLALIIDMHTETNISLFHLLRFTSPALPIGAFAYSQGLESAIELEWISNRADTEAWLVGMMKNIMPYNDLAILQRLVDAKQNDDRVQFEYFNTLLLALRETRELYKEELQLGGTLKRLLLDLEGEDIHEFCELPQLTYVAAFAVALANKDLSDREILSAYLWAWLENQVAAAIKLVPLGQTDGQRILVNATQIMSDVITTALNVEEQDIGTSSPAFTLASCFHETQYSRLFRS